MQIARNIIIFGGSAKTDRNESWQKEKKHTQCGDKTRDKEPEVIGGDHKYQVI